MKRSTLTTYPDLVPPGSGFPRCFPDDTWFVVFTVVVVVLSTVVVGVEVMHVGNAVVLVLVIGDAVLVGPVDRGLECSDD